MDAYDPNSPFEEAVTPSPEQPETPDAPEPVESPDAPASAAFPDSPVSTPPAPPRKTSPYANSPYETNFSSSAPEFTYQPQPRPEKPPKKPHSHRSRRVWSVLSIVLLVAASCLITAYAVNQSWESRSSTQFDAVRRQIATLQEQVNQAQVPSPSLSPVPADGSAMTPSQLYASCVDGVVAISSAVHTSGYYGSSDATSTGSGFVYSQDGYIVTNYHVVEGASSVEVAMYDGTAYPAQVVGYDAANDIAVLKVEATGLSAVALGQSGALSIGDMVVAIGNPLGQLAATQTVGYVSGINREVTTDSTIINMIQTDAAINPGNSGGPLFNMYGQVVGITSAKYSGTTGSGASIEGIGFAIPMDDVVPIISDLISYGYVTGAYMGVTVQNTDADSAAMFGLPTGAYVLEVVEGGSAHRAGIQVKDIIIDIGGNTVTNVTDLTRALRKFKAGDATTVTVIRSGKEITLDITLDEKPQELPEETTPVPDYDDSEEYPFDDWFSWYFGG